MTIRVTAAATAAIMLVVAGCSDSATPTDPPVASSSVGPTAVPVPPPAVAPRVLATDPVQIADDLVADERALREQAAPDDLLVAAANRQQQAYRLLGRHPEWDPITRPRIPPELVGIFDHNIEARRQLEALNAETPVKDTVPAWRIIDAAPPDELLSYYHAAQSDSGVDWAHLAAINLIETGFGRIAGVSTAGAQGPMQFLPSTFAAYGDGGDINSPRDAIMAAGRYLAANGFAHDPDNALFRYNNSTNYVGAVNAYAAALAADPAAFVGYYRWNIYYKTTGGDVVLPVGYFQPEPLPVAQYQSGQRLEQLLTVRRSLSGVDAGELSEKLSGQFLGTPYGANTLIGSATEPEQLVVELDRVDCFTYADYVEALKRAQDRDGFMDALTTVRYRDGVVDFANRKHFFTDWAALDPPIATQVTADLSDRAVAVDKHLNAKDDGGVYLPGLPVVQRTITYLPSGQVDSGVIGRLRTGDYLGAYATDGGLDVTHVGIFVAGPNGPIFRNASSLPSDGKVVDTPLADYLATVPGIVVLRPVL